MKKLFFLVLAATPLLGQEAPSPSPYTVDSVSRAYHPPRVETNNAPVIPAKLPAQNAEPLYTQPPVAVAQVVEDKPAAVTMQLPDLWELSEAAREAGGRFTIDLQGIRYEDILLPLKRRGILTVAKNESGDWVISRPNNNGELGAKRDELARLESRRNALLRDISDLERITTVRPPEKTVGVLATQTP